MNSTPALAFEGTTFHTVQRRGQVWLRASEIAEALGYSRADKVTQIYDRNKDEFSPAMTQNLKLRVKGFGSGNDFKEVRVFSLRGAHLIAMFSRTELAKKFRRWVLDVLDRQLDGLAAEAASGYRLTEADRNSIEGLCCHMAFLHSWWKRVYPGLRALNPQLAAGAYDRFSDGAMFAHGLVAKFHLKSWHRYAAGFPWDGGFTERDTYRRQMERISA